MFRDLRMAERPSLTAQLQWAVVEAEKRVHSAAAAAVSPAASITDCAAIDREGFWTGRVPHLQAAVSCPSSAGGSGSLVSSSPSPDSSGLNVQGWDSEVLSDWGTYGCDGSTPELQRQGSTSAYLEELLSDEGEDIQMLDDLLAYQMIHNEFADMIASVSSRLESCADPAVTASRPNPEVEGWVASVTSAAAAGSPGYCPRFSPSVAQQVEREEESDGASNPDVGGGEGKSLEEVTDMLMDCGEAVAADDAHLATEIVSKIRRFSSPDGSHLQRVAHYFVEALMAKLNGTGAGLYTALMKRDKKAVLEAEKTYMAKDPTPAVCHEFSKSVLLEAFEGATAVHILDYGILGHQWQSLIQALAYRPEGPPRLRITGIEFPQPGVHPDGMVKQTGRRLARLAASLGIPFEFKGFACKWEDVQVSQLGLRDDEVLAVSSVFRLRHLLDDSVVLSNPRRTILERICSMNPKVFIMADRSLAANAPFLMTRLRESIPSWFSFFDFLETIMPRDSVTRRLVEQENFGYRILNTIACEGMDRRERPEAYHQWHWRLVNAGFEQCPLTEKRLHCSRDVLEDYHEDWTLGHDHGWLLTGWKGRIHHAYSAWRPVSS